MVCTMYNSTKAKSNSHTVRWCTSHTAFGVSMERVFGVTVSSSPHHSQTANISLQSVLPIIIINMLSNSIPLQLMSRWSLDSDNYDAHVNLQNQLHSQHPQLPPLAQLCSMQSQSALNKLYAIGDKVLSKGSPEPYIFFLEEKQIH